MLVHHFEGKGACKFPALFVIVTVRAGADSTNDGDVRIFFFDGLVQHLEAFAKGGGLGIFIADTKILQAEGGGMTCLSPFGAPFRVGTAVGPFDQVQHLLDIIRHIFHGDCLLADTPVAVGILAGDTGSDYGKRLSTYVFTKLEILKIAQPN